MNHSAVFRTHLKLATDCARWPIALLAASCTMWTLYSLQGRCHWQTCYAGCATACLTGASFIFNDLFDYHKDTQGGRPDKFLVTFGGRPKQLTMIGTTLLVAALAWGSLVSQGQAILTAGVALAVLYSPFSLKYPMTKNITAGFMCLLPLLYGAQVSNTPLEASWLAPGLAFFVGRELWLDALDQAYDRRAGFHTLAGFLGGQTARETAMLMMVGSLLGLVVRYPCLTITAGCLGAGLSLIRANHLATTNPYQAGLFSRWGLVALMIIMPLTLKGA